MARRVQESLGSTLKQLQQALRVAMDEALRHRSLTAAQFAVLSALDTANGPSGAALARRCAMTPQSMHEMVTHLEAVGLIERRRSEDARVLRTYLTAAGQAVLAGCQQTVDEVEQRMLSRLQERERQQLRASLQRCLDTLVGPPPTAAQPST